jgi:hypothetical protein
MLLTALVLSDDDTLLAAFRGSKVLQRVELSLHACKVFAAQDNVWRSALRGVNDLRQALTSMRPIPPLRELSLHSCKVFAAQDNVWRSALRGVNDLQQALMSMRPKPPLRSHVNVLVLGVSDSGKSTILKVRSMGMCLRTQRLTCGAGARSK